MIAFASNSSLDALFEEQKREAAARAALASLARAVFPFAPAPSLFWFSQDSKPCVCCFEWLSYHQGIEPPVCNDCRSDIRRIEKVGHSPGRLTYPQQIEEGMIYAHQARLKARRSIVTKAAQDAAEKAALTADLNAKLQTLTSGFDAHGNPLGRRR